MKGAQTSGNGLGQANDTAQLHLGHTTTFLTTEGKAQPALPLGRKGHNISKNLEHVWANLWQIGFKNANLIGLEVSPRSG